MMNIGYKIEKEKTKQKNIDQTIFACFVPRKRGRIKFLISPLKSEIVADKNESEST